MSHFYGTLHGNRGIATRCGTTQSGIQVEAASWEGAVRTIVYYNEDEDCDWATVALVPWHGRGVSRILYCGPVSGALAPLEAPGDPMPTTHGRQLPPAPPHER